MFWLLARVYLAKSSVKVEATTDLDNGQIPCKLSAKVYYSTVRRLMPKLKLCKVTRNLLFPDAMLRFDFTVGALLDALTFIVAILFLVAGFEGMH